MLKQFLGLIDESQPVFDAIFLNDLRWHIIARMTSSKTLCGIELERNREYAMVLDELVVDEFRCPDCYGRRMSVPPLATS